MFPEPSALGYAPSAKDRRLSNRRDVDEAAELIIPGEYLTLACRVLNLSGEGACIKCDIIPLAATKVRLVLQNGRAFEGVTAWFEAGQLGLRFVTAPD